MMTRRHHLPVLVLTALLGSGAFAAPDPVYRDGVSGAEMQALAQNAMAAANVAGKLSISTSRGYPPCATAPLISPHKGKWSMLIAQCNGKSGWSRHIRTSIKPGRAIFSRSLRPQPDGPMVAVLTKSLKRDSVITAADIEMRPIPRATGAGAFSDPRHVIGQRVTKNLAEGRAIQARHLQKNWMIGRDMPVAIEFAGKGMSISAPGLSLENGELGEYIEVRNLSSGTVLKGRVSGPQKITVRAKTR